jgi:hypothetical protein
MSYLGIAVLGLTLSRTTLLIVAVVAAVIIVGAWYLTTHRR